MTNSLQVKSGEKETSASASESQDDDAESKETTAEKSSGETTTSEHKGEKRKREGDSPDREGVQKVRAKSPIKEDEPAINNDNVQLNWCK